MKSIDLKKLLPHLIILALFLFITLINFTPILEGKQLNQMDVTNALGMQKEILDFQEETGQYSPWTNSMFGGMPAYQIIGFEFKNIFKTLHKWFRIGLPTATMAILWIYLIGMYILLLSLRVDPWLSLAGSIAFALSSYNFIIIEVGHISKCYAIGYMAPTLAGIVLVFRQKYFLGGILTTLFLGIEIASNHPQINYYLGMIVLAVLIVECIYAFKEKLLKHFAISSVVLLTAAVLALLPNTSSLWPTYEYGKESIRGPSELVADQTNQSSGLDKDYALDWSYGKSETFTILIPDFAGGGSSGKLDETSESYKVLAQNGVPNAREIAAQMPTYWGVLPFTAGPFYFGAIICFLFVFGLFVVKGRVKWWVLGITVLGIMLAWGKHFETLTDLFFFHVPLYNKFRAVSTTLVIASLTMPVLGILSLQEIFQGNTDKRTLVKHLLYALGIVGGLALIFLLVPGIAGSFAGKSDEYMRQSGYPDWLINALVADRRTLLQRDAFRSLAFIVAAAGIIWLLITGKIKKPLFTGLLTLFILLDLMVINHRYMNKDTYQPKRVVKEKRIQPTQANLDILQDKDPDFRVFNTTVNPFTDAHTSYFHKSIGGYHGAKLRRYQELIEHQISKNNMWVLNMLNTKYFIVKGPEGRPTAQRNFGALGNSWFVRETQLVDNANEEMDALTTFIPAKTAVIDKRFEPLLDGFHFQEDSLAQIVLTAYQPNAIHYSSKSATEQLAVFSEIYYPHGWNVYVDGEQTTYFRANYLLRAMRVPAGDHEIVFKFEPESYYTGQQVSLYSSIVVVILLLLAIAYEVNKNLRKENG